MCSPVNNEVLIGGLLVTDWTHPGRLLLIHLDVKCSIEALKVRTCQRSARDRQPHLPQLYHKTKKYTKLMLLSFFMTQYCRKKQQFSN